MTTPEGGAFEYTDDSVVARVSVDIPNQAVTDISQLTAAMSAMRTELEAIARAQSNWVDYLQQMPVIVEQSNQALRNQITLMERMSYLQGEVGGGFGAPAGTVPGGAGGPSGNPGAGGVAGPGGYSTAAPAGYRDPFAGMAFGTGAGTGPGGSGEMQQYMEQMAQTDPRTYANMAAARGLPVNPSMLGALGAAAMAQLGMMGGSGGGSGHGNDPADSQSPQKGNSSRRSGKPPNQNQRGQSSDSENQDEPSEPTDDSPLWRHGIDGIVQGAKQVYNERILGGRGLPGKIARAGAALGKKTFGGSGTGAKFARGLGLTGAGLVAAHQIQNVGEMVTEYQQLGSVRGGDYMTGMGMELENRIRAIDPFVNLPQTREAMQAAYSNGFAKNEIDEVQSFALKNFKELGISMQDTARMLRSALGGAELGDEAAVLERKERLDSVLTAMKELSAEGGATLPTRQKQLAMALEQLVPSGFSDASVERSQLRLQEAFADSRVLSEEGSSIANSVASSPTLLSIAGQRLGVTGIVPSGLGPALEDAGYDADTILEVAAAEMAKAVAGIEPRYSKIGTFWDIMRQQGADIKSYRAAEELYDKVTGEGIVQVGADRVKENTKPKMPSIPGWGAVKKAGQFLAGVPGWIQDRVEDQSRDAVGLPSREAVAAAAAVEEGTLPRGDFRPTGAPPAAPPNSAAAVPPSVNTQGQVTGRITITVDQNGKVSAPQSIQLSGTQQSSFLGWGSSQVNNIPPGESHAQGPLGRG